MSGDVLDSDEDGERPVFDLQVLIFFGYQTWILKCSDLTKFNFK